MKLLLLAYIVAGLYSLGLLWSLLVGLKNNDLSNAYDNLTFNKYAIFILVVAIIATPIHFWVSLSHVIPDESYFVNVSVECYDGTKFDAKGTILFSEDVEYYESGRESEPLFGMSNGDKRVVYRNFYLTDVDCSSKYEVIVDPDEPIDGNTVDATVYYNTYDEVEVDAKVILPALTDNLNYSWA